MALYTIGDLHLSFGADKPMDHFKGWDNYVQRLERNWRALVEPGDTVMIAGDISWGMTLEEAAPDFAFLQSLPGRKLMIKGNHDYWWTTRRKMDLFFEKEGFDSLRIVHNDAVAVEDRWAVCGTRGWFYDAEADADKRVLHREIGRLHASAQEAKKTGLPLVAFLHYPPVFGDSVCEEMLQALKDEGITRCYYGHIHGASIRKAFNGTLRGIELKLVSGDALSFVPCRVF